MLVDIVSLVLAVLLFIICLVAYFRIVYKTRRKLVFWPMMASSMVIFAITHIMSLTGIDVGWYFMYERIVGYVLIFLALVVLYLESQQTREKN
jgi:uncharacterized membrane protein